MLILEFLKGNIFYITGQKESKYFTNHQVSQSVSSGGVSCPTDAAPRDYTTNNLKLNQIEAYRSIYSNILVGFLENKSKLEGINLYLR